MIMSSEFNQNQSQFKSMSRFEGKVSQLGLQSLVHAKKLREAKEAEVRKLHMRIASL